MSMEINQEVRGNTLKVYLYLLRHGSSELREVQRGLNFSSASLASYHLSKLLEMGLAKQDEYGKYSPSKEASHMILEDYLKIGSVLIPQLFFFSLLFTILMIFFSVGNWSGLNFVPYLIGVSFTMLAVLWYWTIKLWRKIPL
jgi:hypothetical protein